MKKNLASKAILLALLLMLSGFITLEYLQINGFSPVPVDPEVDRVLVIANRNSPVSLRVAQYYQQRRGIPPNHFFTLDLPDSSLTPGLESISYATYQTQVEQPLRDFLTRKDWVNRIRYIVLTKGIPLRIKDIPYRLKSGEPLNQHQSIDSTLAALDYRVSPIEFKDMEYKELSGKEIFGLLTPNLYWRQGYPFEHQLTGGYLVNRLDGYSEADARALVDRALSPRPSLSGTVLIDPSGNHEHSNNPKIIDIYDPQSCKPKTIPQVLSQCIPQPRAMMEATGHDLNNDLRLGLPMLQASFSQLQMTLAPPQSFATGDDLMAYASWGSNDTSFDIEHYRNLKFRPGAIAETFVSTGARSFFPSSIGQSLIGDLMGHSGGVTGIRGYIEEPELQGMGSPMILFSRYFGGANLATAYYQSIRFVGWRDVVLGDPLATAIVKQSSVKQSSVKQSSVNALR
jgi:hypothetical protein